MTDKFLNGLETVMNGDDNVATTENGALAFRTTKSAVLDFFAVGGALRSRTPESKIKLFDAAYAEDRLLALKSLFYFRDVRGGQGERATFREVLAHLAKTDPEVVRANINNIAEYGRWDDLYVLEGTELEDDMYAVFAKQLVKDLRAEHPSLLAKWLKSENTSSKESRRLAKKTRIALGMSSRTYRKTLSMLRQRINVLERQLSENKWENIDYERIPSKAGLKYRKAFQRHDEDRYKIFLEAVKAGKAKINAGTLYPYEIVEKCGGFYGNAMADVDTLDAMWNALPNYFEGNEGVRGMVVADVSGSMMGRPMDVSVSLAIYTAERNTGPFAGKYITFTDKPKLVTVQEGTIADKVQQIMHTDVGYNSNVEAVFDLILTTAVRNKLSQDDLPTHLYIVSDMEFDEANSGANWYRPSTKPADERLFQTIANKYEKAGYQMPFLVFWNVDSRNNQQPMSMDQRGFQLVSGCSPSIFTSLLSNKAVSAYDLMVETLNTERYAAVRLPE